ncbi:MAG: HK97 gp10 family phage protein [bacterium]
MSIQFEWDNPNRVVAEVTRMLNDRGRAIRAIPDRAVRRGTFELLKLVQTKVPKVTSTLVRSITAVVKRISADVVEGKVGTWLEYARYVEYGTGIYGPLKRPITIAAKNKRGLFWGAYDEDGKPIVRRRVQIKGMKPRSPFGQAVAEFLPRYIEIIQQELAREATA